MNGHSEALEASLNREASRWKRGALVRHSLELGTGFILWLLLLECAAIFGWLTSKPLALELVFAAGALGLAGWTVMALSVRRAVPDRAALAAAIEGAEPRLLDRLNTLVSLEGGPDGMPRRSFAARIARQAERFLTERPLRSSVGSAGLSLRALAFGACLGATVLVALFCAPWTRLRTIPGDGKEAIYHSAHRPPQPPGGALSDEKQAAWGQVRITKPGANISAEKTNVVKLEIEAATSRRMTNVRWFSAINGGDETPHQLLPPPQDRYASYRPELRLERMPLSDWDVLTYYAKADTEDTNSYASQIFFLEIRPPRQRLLNMPGGAQGQPYRALSELSSLIRNQEEVIRQTHQHLQGDRSERDEGQGMRARLSEAEEGLREATRHFQAKISGQMGAGAAGDSLDDLAGAQNSLAAASGGLRNNDIRKARETERLALSQLLAARKAFHEGARGHASSGRGGRDSAPKSNDADRQLAEAYKLEQELAEQARTFEFGSRSNSPLSERALLETARQTRRTLSGLKGLVERAPTRESFGKSLRDALSEEQVGKITELLDGLARAGGAADRQGRSAEVATRLRQVDKAFLRSEPKALQLAQNRDVLAGPQEKSVTAAARTGGEELKEELMASDLAHFPSAYRRRIEHYFQMLSER